jgi:hypothetical protein
MALPLTFTLALALPLPLTLALTLPLPLTLALPFALTLPLTLALPFALPLALPLLTEPLLALALALALLLATPSIQLLVHRVEAARRVSQLLPAPLESLAALGLTGRLGRCIDALLGLLQRLRDRVFDSSRLARPAGHQIFRVLDRLL